MLSDYHCPTATANSALDSLTERVRHELTSGKNGHSEDDIRASVAFLTIQGSQHTGRKTGYVNTVLSVRVGRAVGSCAVEPNQAAALDVSEITGSSVAELLEHPETAVRVAALDAYLASVTAHTEHRASEPVRVPAGTSLEKSLARVHAVAGLLDLPSGSTVAVIGVVNSLLNILRELGFHYIPCDIKGGETEWSEPIHTDHRTALPSADAVLASGMTLGNGTFDEIAEFCQTNGRPLVIYAQTGSAVFRELLGTRINALSAEPYPFFWLTGDSTDIYLYRDAHGGEHQ